MASEGRHQRCNIDTVGRSVQRRSLCGAMRPELISFCERQYINHYKTNCIKCVQRNTVIRKYFYSSRRASHRLRRCYLRPARKKCRSIVGSDWPQLKAPSPGAVKSCTSCFFLGESDLRTEISECCNDFQHRCRSLSEWPVRAGINVAILIQWAARYSDGAYAGPCGLSQK